MISHQLVVRPFSSAMPSSRWKDWKLWLMKFGASGKAKHFRNWQLRRLVYCYIACNGRRCPNCPLSFVSGQSAVRR